MLDYASLYGNYGGPGKSFGQNTSGKTPTQIVAALREAIASGDSRVHPEDDLDLCYLLHDFETMVILEAKPKPSDNPDHLLKERIERGVIARLPKEKQDRATLLYYGWCYLMLNGFCSFNVINNATMGESDRLYIATFLNQWRTEFDKRYPPKS